MCNQSSDNYLSNVFSNMCLIVSMHFDALFTQHFDLPLESKKLEANQKNGENQLQWSNEYGQNKLLMLVFACVGEMINLQTRFYGRFCVCTLEVIGMFIRY